MKRRDFLRSIINTAPVVIACPALLCTKNQEEENWTAYGNNAIISDKPISNEWQHHESYHFVKGQNYRVTFDYITHNNEPMDVTVDNLGVFYIKQKNIPKGESVCLTDVSLKQISSNNGRGFRQMQTVEEYILSKTRLP